MTSLVETDPGTHVDESRTVEKPNEHTFSDACYSHNRQRRHVLKSKENAYRHKCYKLLKKKLKKYKLRQDGTEDQDVLDVSKIFSSLVIKSPNNEPLASESDLSYFGEVGPKNYLFKMVRRKNSAKIGHDIKSLTGNINRNHTIDKTISVVNEEKKHTNAFQLLMDSRNKSIGSNSPGKEQTVDHLDNEEILKKKSAKAKRDLLLQKMAESKGFYKNKELEEYHDKIIKKKMKKRAERLKIMILKETKQSKVVECAGNSELKETKDLKLDKKIESKNNAVSKQTKTFKIVDIFNTFNDPVSENSEKEVLSKEDSEFINKLSPSLKKTESVLSYFKKVDKEPELFSVDVENDNLRGKPKRKPTTNRGRKKLSLKKDADVYESHEVNNENDEIKTFNSLEVKSSNERQKRKRCTKDKGDIVNNIALNNNCESRPKRCVKKPVKYIDDVHLSSSDEDLNIFTPKKKKYFVGTTSNNKEPSNLQPIQVVDEPLKSSNSTKKIKDTATSKKPIKLAPIFAAKPDSAALEAKQKFLQSGVPDKLKKIINQQHKNSKLTSDFPIVVHVQQTDTGVAEVHQPLLNILDFDTADTFNLVNEKNAFKKLLNLNDTYHIEAANNNKSVKIILQNIKQVHPKFPVYRTFHYLRSKSKGENKDYKQEFDNSIEVMNDLSDFNYDSPDRLTWTDKYKAMSTRQIIGNFESVKELKKWLVTWSENELKSKNKGNDASDSDFYHSDTDSRDNFKSMNNLLILTGPTGSGKTSSVYAVAADLSMKVIEVNASSKRTGKIMLQDLQEATQSHKVNRGTSNENSQKSQEKNLTELLKNSKKRGRPKKSTGKVKDKCPTPSTQESTRTGMSLILIDDADIVFDQDDGFSSAIVQLVYSSKRPVILITSSLSSPHLQRFLQSGKILKMCPLSPSLLGTWLDIMCLADSGISWPGAGAKFLDYFKGDIRKTINYLQFYISSYTGMNMDDEKLSQNIDNYKTTFEDENSGMSWVEREDLEIKQLTPVNNNIDMQLNTMWADFDNNNSDITNYRHPLNLFNVWWSAPNLLGIVPNSITVPKLDIKSRDKEEEVKSLEAIADVLDAISLSDCVVGSGLYSTVDITCQPWCSSDSDSMSEQENVDYYMKEFEVSRDICHMMVSGYVATAQSVLKCERTRKITFPGMSLQRKRDNVASLHTNLTSYLNPWSILDRRSLTMDYWSSCRTICRVEKAKSETIVNSKRHNRFCHYLKSLNVLFSNDLFNNLCHSLSNE